MPQVEWERTCVHEVFRESILNGGYRRRMLFPDNDGTESRGTGCFNFTRKVFGCFLELTVDGEIFFRIGSGSLLNRLLNLLFDARGYMRIRSFVGDMPHTGNRGCEVNNA